MRRLALNWSRSRSSIVGSSGCFAEHLGRVREVMTCVATASESTVRCRYERTFVLLACLFSIGCGPAAPPVWNKDSRSFFYCRTDGAVMQYDLDKQANRMWLGPGQPQPRQIALSTKTSALAFAQAAIGTESRAVQIGVSSLLKIEPSWSKLEIWGDPSARRVLCPVSCYWCPSGQRVLIWYQEGADIPGLIQSTTPFGRFAVYDIASKKLSELTTSPPAVILGQAINASPICPDGSGYLGMKLADKGPQFSFVTWEGWEYPLALGEEVKALLNLAADTSTENDYKMRKFFPLPQGIWAGNVLKFTLRDGTVVIDPKARKITIEAVTEGQQQEFDQIDAADSADAPCTTIQTASFHDGPFSVQARMKTGGGQIELVDFKEGRRRVLLNGIFPVNFFTHHLFPSPDGRFILASLIDEAGKQTWIHVIKADGSLLTKVDQGPLASAPGHK
jgi:hypothetical protein